jgi:hypothetical protein
MGSTRRIHQMIASCLASMLTVLFLAGPLAAHAQGTAADLALHAYAFKYRQASEAVRLVYPLLSQGGTVELQPATNTLVIRDTNAALNRILPVLHTFDHPLRPVIMDLYIVRASRSQVSPPVARSNLPDTITRKLRALFTYDSFEVQAQAQLSSVEGQSVTYAVADDYRVTFRNGALSADQQLSLGDVHILRRTSRRAMVPLAYYPTVSLRLDQPTTLGLAKSEASPEALLFVWILRSGDSTVHRMQRAEP